MPGITSSTRLILGIVSAAAGIIASLIGNVLAINFVYFFTRKGRQPTQRPIYIWIIFYLSVAVFIVLGSYAAFAPTEFVETDVTPVGYDFESDTMGWNTSEGDYKRAILNTTTLVAYKGKQALVLDTELYGSGSPEYTDHNKEDVYRHTEALVYFNQIPAGIDYPGPYDLTGKRLSCFVYVPIGLVAPDNTPPAYVRLILKDKNFANQFSEAIIINDETVEQWLELIYVVNPDPNSDFDMTHVNAMGVRLDTLDDSIIDYKGPIYIDYCTINFKDEIEQK